MTLLIGDQEPGFRGIMKSCNWNVSHLHDLPYSAILIDSGSDVKEVDTAHSTISDDSKNTKYISHQKPTSALETVGAIEENGYDIINDICGGNGGNISGNGLDVSECRVILVSGVTGTGDICVRENLDLLDSLLTRELPEECEVDSAEESEVEGEIEEVEDEHIVIANGVKADSEVQMRIQSQIAIEKKSGVKIEMIAGTEMSKPIEKNISKEPRRERRRRRMVQFVCSDGFDHETEAFRIVLGQVIGMIKCLKVGGNFIMKVFSCTKVR